MTFILEGKYENILGKYRKVISSKVILIVKVLALKQFTKINI